jgi:hypothetical protein
MIDTAVPTASAAETRHNLTGRSKLVKQDLKENWVDYCTIGIPMAPWAAKLPLDMEHQLA